MQKASRLGSAFHVFKLIMIFISILSCRETAIDRSLPQVPASTIHTMQFIGDSRGGPEIYSSLLEIGYTHFPKGPVIHLGDIISTPDHPEEYGPFKALSKLFVPRDRLYVTIGNHDVDDEISMLHAYRVFPEVGPQGYYSRIIDNCYCIFLNSEDQSEGGNRLGASQREWLLKELSSPESQAAKYRLVMVHKPIFPQNQHKDDPLADAEELHALFVQYKVNMVLSGHEHAYSRITRDGVEYLMSGGGGSPLYNNAGPAAFYHYVQMFETESQLKFYAIDFLGRTKDEFSIDLARP